MIAEMVDNVRIVQKGLEPRDGIAKDLRLVREALLLGGSSLYTELVAERHFQRVGPPWESVGPTNRVNGSAAVSMARDAARDNNTSLFTIGTVYCP